VQKLTDETARHVLGAMRGRRHRKKQPMLPDDGLDRWICDLRDHLECGDLVGLRSIELGHGTRHLGGETTVRVMLADLADLHDPDGSASGGPAWHQERLCSLHSDFRWLRELLG